MVTLSTCRGPEHAQCSGQTPVTSVLIGPIMSPSLWTPPSVHLPPTIQFVTGTRTSHSSSLWSLQITRDNLRVLVISNSSSWSGLELDPDDHNGWVRMTVLSLCFHHSTLVSGDISCSDLLTPPHAEPHEGPWSGVTSLVTTLCGAEKDYCW